MRKLHRTKAETPPEEDGLEPLFNYGKIQPRVVLDDDDDEDEEPALPLKWQARMKKARMDAPKPADAERPAPVILEESIDDWLAPPPGIVPTGICMDSATVLQLRQKRFELMQIANRPAPTLPAPAAPSPSPAPPPSLSTTSTARPTVAKSSSQAVKVRIFIQDKDGNRKQYAFSKTERLERLFNAYANFSGVKSSDLVFKFDGEPLEPGSTLQEHDIEDEDQIEVFRKR